MIWQQLGPNLPTRGNRFTAFVGRLLFRVMGWRIEGEFPNQSKLIVAVAPHTSNTDFFLAMAIVSGLGLHASYFAKQSLFKFPLRPLMVALGGIPVDRSSSQGLIGQMVEHFEKTEKLVLGITPEGTRGKVGEWKRGFALIAQAANVPILPAILDVESKVVRFEKLITEVSDVDQVISTMQELAKAGSPGNL
ncbi:MAG: 1-acyl-sn-glycerol-3-phosphate acyltransferase [Gammaproteobacteria bacterium]|nr:1-acyl-sn-glycerol-3-phosphate acyltransferase [Gammaproteobacteria bacterium]